MIIISDELESKLQQCVLHFLSSDTSTKLLMLSLEPFRSALNAVSFISSKVAIASKLFVEQLCCLIAASTSTTFGTEPLFMIDVLSTSIARERNLIRAPNAYQFKSGISKSNERTGKDGIGKNSREFQSVIQGLNNSSKYNGEQPHHHTCPFYRKQAFRSTFKCVLKFLKFSTTATAHIRQLIDEEDVVQVL